MGNVLRRPEVWIVLAVILLGGVVMLKKLENPVPEEQVSRALQNSKEEPMAAEDVHDRYQEIESMIEGQEGVDEGSKGILKELLQESRKKVESGEAQTAEEILDAELELLRTRLPLRIDDVTEMYAVDIDHESRRLMYSSRIIGVDERVLTYETIDLIKHQNLPHVCRTMNEIIFSGYVYEYHFANEQKRPIGGYVISKRDCAPLWRIEGLPGG